MDGLINQARSQLWAVVNSLIPLTRDGRRPTLQVALYEDGKTSIPAAEQRLRQVLPFTTDLDRVSEQLFALTTNGGEGSCKGPVSPRVRERLIVSGLFVFGHHMGGPMDIRHRVGQRIRDLRNDRGWTLEKLAERSGKHWTYLGGIERGIRNPTICVLEVIARALEVPISDFFAETKHRRHQ